MTKVDQEAFQDLTLSKDSLREKIDDESHVKN